MIDTINGVPVSSNLSFADDINIPTTFSYDKVFENLVDNIVPKKISDENKALIESFVDILADFSPISINIIDAFNKSNSSLHENHIRGVQDGFAQMYLENFWSVIEKAKKDYNLQTRLENILAKYRALEGGEDIGIKTNLKFFGNIDELFTEERFVLGKDFKEKKGTSTAIEYAYKVGWLAEIEGPLRDAYFFKLISNECVGGVPQGMRIACESPYISPTAPNPPSHASCTGTPFPGERFINNFYIGDVIDGLDCTPFAYKVEGSMIPTMFEAFVMPLSHPVGFQYAYAKILDIAFIDYFNLEYIYRADKVSVKVLCPEGDCSTSSEDIYATKDGTGSITGSSLKYFDSGEIYQGEFKGYLFEKYTFDNGSYVISYKTESNRGVVEEVVQYFNIADLDASESVVDNGDFSDDLVDWEQYEPNPQFNEYDPISDPSSPDYDPLNPEYDPSYEPRYIPITEWNIVDGRAVYDTTEKTDQYLSQRIALEEGVTYNVEFNSYLNGRTHNFTVSVGGVAINVVGIGQQRSQITIPIGQDGIIKIWGFNSVDTDFDPVTTLPIPNYFSIDDIKINKVEATVTYPNYTHSSIIVDNPASPLAVLYTHDIFDIEFEVNLGSNIVVPKRTNVLLNGEFNLPITTEWTTTGTAWKQANNDMVFTKGDDTSILTQNVTLIAGATYEIRGHLIVEDEKDGFGNDVRYNYLTATIIGGLGTTYEFNHFGVFSVLYVADGTETAIEFSGHNIVVPEGASFTLKAVNLINTKNKCTNAVINGRFNIDANNELINGNFDDPVDDDWNNVGIGWTQVGNAMEFSGDNTSTLGQAVAWQNGKVYNITGNLEVASYDDYLTIEISPSKTIKINNFGVFSEDYQADGTEYSQMFLSGENGVSLGNIATLTLDSIEVHQADGIGFHGWDVGVNWFVEDTSVGIIKSRKAVHIYDTLNLPQPTEPLLQRLNLIGGNTYRINVDVDFASTIERASLVIGGELYTIGGNGTARFEFYAPTTAVYDLSFYGEATFSVDNVVVDCNENIIADEMKSLYTNKLAIIGNELYIAQAQLDTDVTQEGGFIIGGIILPHGDISTQYMFDDLTYIAEGQEWVRGFDPIDFIEPLNWTQDIGWNIINGSNPTQNYAFCDGSQTGFARLRQIFEIDDNLVVGHTDEHFVNVNFSLEHSDLEDVPGFVRVHTNIFYDDINGNPTDIIDFHDTGTYSFLMKYNHSKEGTTSPNMLWFEASYNNSSISGEWIVNLSSNIATIPAVGEVVIDTTVDVGGQMKPTFITYNYIDNNGIANELSLDNARIGDNITLSDVNDSLKNLTLEIISIDTTPIGAVTYTVSTLHSGNVITNGDLTFNIIPQLSNASSTADFIGSINNVETTYIKRNP